MPFFEVNLSNYRRNIETIKSLIPRDCSLMAIVKSDAYGLGIEKISREAHDCGIRWFGIAKAEEALLLRDVLGGDVRIVQVSPFTAKDAPRLVEAGVIPIISSIDEARALSEESLKKGRKTSVHLGIDTGMGRMGFMPRDAVTVFQELVSLEALSLDGLFSHFPSADEDDEKFTKGQLMSFKELASEMERKLNKKLIKHIANSSAVFRYPDSHMDLARCGIASYGASPSAGFMLKEIIPVVSVKAKVVLIKKVLKGQGISYNRTFIAPEDKTIALVDIGYGEGYSRGFSSCGHMLIRENKAFVLGRVTMDLTVVDVSHIKNVSVGDEAVIVGSQGNERITVEDFASCLDTVPYEVFCTMGKMLKKIYH